MAKPLNGIFREWIRCTSPDDPGVSLIWGYCVVHLGNPRFSGNVIHTSKIYDMARHDTFSIAETRNSYYVILGPELDPPPAGVEPRDHVLAHKAARPHAVDAEVNAAVNADPDCAKCFGSGVYRTDDGHTAVCDACCKHNAGWWRLEGFYGEDNGKWACKAGCGKIVDEPPLEFKFLPRTRR